MLAAYAVLNEEALVHVPSHLSFLPCWDEKVRELTTARGVDCVVEIGGRGRSRCR